MGNSAALLLAVVFALANLAMGVAGFIISRRRFPDLVEPLHIQFILLGCGLILAAAMLAGYRLSKAGKAPNGWVYGLSEVPAILGFVLLGWRGLFTPSWAPLVCTSLVQFAVLLPATMRIKR